MSDPKFSPDDPRLTAYALGELDVAESAAVEAMLAADPAARAAVAEIRRAAIRLSEALANEAVERTFSDFGREDTAYSFFPYLAACGLAAAVVAIVAIRQQRHQPAPQVAAVHPMPTAKVTMIAGNTTEVTGGAVGGKVDLGFDFSKSLLAQPVAVRRMDVANITSVTLGAGVAGHGSTEGIGGGGNFGIVISGALAGGAITLGERPLLFIDDSGVASQTGLVRRLHPGEVYPSPIITADRPWEGQRVYLFGTVRYDWERRRFEMWYQGSPGPGQRLKDTKKDFVPEFREGGATLVLYATSADGLHWEKPNLGLHAFEGSTANNIVFDLNSPSVLADPFATDSSRRFKMLGTSGGSYWAAVSPDGLHWRSDTAGPILPYSDTITLAQDPRTGEYLAFHKRPWKVEGTNRRVVWLSRSTDFRHWSEPILVMAPDRIDDAWVRLPPERTEFYNMSVFPHAGGFVGLLTVFHVQQVIPAASAGPGQSPTDGPIGVEIAASPDGTHWTRPVPRSEIIPHGAPGSFNAGAILGLANSPVEVGAQTWVYYTVLTTTHGAPIPPKRISIALAHWRRNGFVSLEAGRGGGELTTVPLRLARAALVVNATGRGELRAAVLEADGRPIAGLGLGDCEAVRGDSVEASLQWKGGRLPPTDRAVRVRLVFSDGGVFGLATKRLRVPLLKPEVPLH